jgi:hypothetical protein
MIADFVWNFVMMQGSLGWMQWLDWLKWHREVSAIDVFQ